MLDAVSPGVVLLMPSEFGAALMEPASAIGYGPVSCINTREGLEAAFENSSPCLLLSFSTGVIVPADILGRRNLLALNIHGASPSYPGRDPHHFAAYDDARTYGATLHFMVRNVDAGPLIRTSLEEVAPGSGPVELMAIGVRHGLALARAVLAELAMGAKPVADPALRWLGPVRKRSDFLRLCQVEPGMTRGEFERRLRATSMPGYRNLTVALHGHTFRIEPE